MTAIPYYNANASALVSQYESLAAESLHSWLVDLLPKNKNLALDVGAGSGRDAAWLASLGFEVVAVEPSAGMRNEARRLHESEKIQWLDDSLPDFRVTQRLGLSFDVILLSAVWMHLLPADRPRAFRKLITLLKPGGLLALTLRIGPAAPERAMFEVSEQEIEKLAKNHGVFIERRMLASDQGGRTEVSWIQLALRLPDDGTGALPLLRYIIFNDDKSSTYKLALLRVLCRIADGAAGYARPVNNDLDSIEIPLGLVALFWLRLYLPLLKANLPQQPNNKGLDGLGFVKEALRGLIGSSLDTSPLDLRVGMRFEGERAQLLHQALRDACKTIETMPVRYLTHPDGSNILTVMRQGRLSRRSQLLLDEAYLSSFGYLRLPLHLYTALQRFDVWIEPALIAEWLRLIKVYVQSQGRKVDDHTLAQALQWSDPERDVALARSRALMLMQRGDLHCVYTNQRLTSKSLDIDHCLPWHAWPCSDLWNLMPANAQVNRVQKRDRLPSEMMLATARERIEDWWGQAYDGDLGERFRLEAQASLPLVGAGATPSEIYAGLRVQRLRLRFDQGASEWGSTDI